MNVSDSSHCVSIPDYSGRWMYGGRRKILAHEALLLFWVWGCAGRPALHHEGESAILLLLLRVSVRRVLWYLRRAYRYHILNLGVQLDEIFMQMLSVVIAMHTLTINIYFYVNFCIIFSQVSTRAKWHMRVSTGMRWRHVSAAPAASYLSWAVPSSHVGVSSSVQGPARWGKTLITLTPATRRCRASRPSIGAVAPQRNTSSHNVVLHSSH